MMAKYNEFTVNYKLACHIIISTILWGLTFCLPGGGELITRRDTKIGYLKFALARDEKMCNFTMLDLTINFLKKRHYMKKKSVCHT